MKFSPGWPRAARAGFLRQVAISLSFLAAPMAFKFEKSASARPVATVQPPMALISSDPRLACLTRFFAHLHCPVAMLVADFLNAADDNGLDWRLLPSISVIESSGGKAYRNNNVFGWANGDWFFPTVRTGIHEVAFRLGNSSIYRNRSIYQKLHLYNPDVAYPGRVMSVMQRISPNVQLGALPRIMAQR